LKFCFGGRDEINQDKNRSSWNVCRRKKQFQLQQQCVIRIRMEGKNI